MRMFSIRVAFGVAVLVVVAAVGVWSLRPDGAGPVPSPEPIPSDAPAGVDADAAVRVATEMYPDGRVVRIRLGPIERVHPYDLGLSADRWAWVVTLEGRFGGRGCDLPICGHAQGRINVVVDRREGTFLEVFGGGGD